MTDAAKSIPVSEARVLFRDLEKSPALIVAVSGGPDSTALLLLAARWRDSLRNAPELIAVTVDHGLRAESVGEAKAVAALARKLGVAHRTLRWSGTKPKAGLQEAARNERYRLLAAAAKKAGATHVITAHTLDDQAETVLMRLARGSGIAGLAAMTRESALAGVTIVRPFLDIPKARLLATLRREKIPFADDTSNRDPRFTRVRMRALMPLLEREGLTPRRLVLLARRARRAEEALASAVAQASHAVSRGPWSEGTRLEFDLAAFLQLPAEVSLRLLGRAVAHAGDEGPVELAKLETLHDVLRGDAARGGAVRRTLAGAVVCCRQGTLVIERAPARRSRERSRISALTKSQTAAGRTA